MSSLLTSVSPVVIISLPLAMTGIIILNTMLVSLNELQGVACAFLAETVSPRGHKNINVGSYSGRLTVLRLTMLQYTHTQTSL